MGLGRLVPLGKNHAEQIENILRDPTFQHVYFDISWDEGAKYLVADTDARKRMADLMERYPDRFYWNGFSCAPGIKPSI
jgi:hypothetical protein